MVCDACFINISSKTKTFLVVPLILPRCPLEEATVEHTAPGGRGLRLKHGIQCRLLSPLCSLSKQPTHVAGSPPPGACDSGGCAPKADHAAALLLLFLVSKLLDRLSWQ
jgi:hypothetical protein